MKRAPVLLALLALPAAPLAAQVSVDFTPRLGVYIPLKDLTVGTDPTTGLALTRRAQSKFTIGGRLGVWVAPAFGFEGVVDYNHSGVNSTLGGFPNPPTVASRFFATSGRAMIRLGAGSSVAMILSGGVGLVDRGGEFITGPNPPFTTFSGRTDVAPAGGVSFLVRLSSTWAARIDVDGITYRAEYVDPINGSTGSRRQYDLLITFGFTGPFKNYGTPGE
jgi:hypothetical protein